MRDVVYEYAKENGFINAECYFNHLDLPYTFMDEEFKKVQEQLKSFDFLTLEDCECEDPMLWFNE